MKNIWWAGCGAVCVCGFTSYIVHTVSRCLQASAAVAVVCVFLLVEHRDFVVFNNSDPAVCQCV